MSTVRRYPFEVLEDLISRRLAERDVTVTTRAIAVELGEDGNTIARARHLGLQREQAERMAIAAGYHPVELWPEIVDHDLEDLGDGEVECAAWDCTNRFMPSGRGGSRRWPQRFCSDGCRFRSKQRRLQGTPPPSLKTCEASDCDETFVAGGRQRFCSKTCRLREKQRRHRAKPEAAEAHRQAVARYRAEVKELVARRAERQAA